MLKNLKLGTKLTSGFLALVVLTLILAATSLVGIARVSATANTVTADDFPSLQGIELLNAGVADLRGVELAGATALRAASARLMVNARETLERTQKEELDRGQAIYEALPRTAAEDSLWREFKERYAEYRAHIDAVQEAIGSSDLPKVDSLVVAGMALFNATRAPIIKLAELTDGFVQERAATLAAESRTARTVTIVAALLATVLGIAFGILFSRAIVRPVKAVAERTEQLRSVCMSGLESGLVALSRGDVNVAVTSGTTPLEIDAGDEIGDLARTVDRMIAQTQASIAAYSRVQQTLGALVSETGALTTSARMGRLDARGDAAAFEGTYSQLVAAVNETLDAVLAPVKETSAALERVAERDLTARVQGEYLGDHATIKNAFNRALDSIEAALADVSAASQQVAGAAAQITAGSQSLSSGANDQASSLQEVSSSLHEMSSMATRSAANAREARTLADGTRAATVKGVEDMRALTDAMGAIKQSADATARIVKTIDEIAFQTNLLALNAAVEAARAGDAGRGFAVVAEEVRSLAQRSAEAARQTSELIQEAVQNTERGVSLTGDVVRSLDDIDARALKVSEVMGEVSAASQQQTDGIGQVNSAVALVNGVTQQVAANAEESAAAAEELTGQAGHLQTLVASFRLTAGRGTGAAAGGPARPRAATRRMVAAAPAPAPAARAVAPERRFAKVDPESVIPFHDDGDDDTLQEF